MKEKKYTHIQTQAIHSGEEPDPVTKASAPNIVMSTTFVADPDTSFSVEGMNEDASFVYTRWGNPTVRQLELKLAALESAESCIVFASGMAAVTSLLLSKLQNGDHLIISDVAYAATSESTNELYPQLGIKVTKVNTSDLNEVRAAITDKTKLIYVETPNNPILRLTDINAVAEIAHSAGALLAVDSTFATPVATKPLLFGADFVIHSLSKYLCGHGDAIGGALLGKNKDISDIRKRIAVRIGGIISPFNAWLILRGIATLPLRMKAHQDNGLLIAKFLEEQPKVTKVIYPGLPSHPQYALAKRQMDNFSGMLTFQVRNGSKAAKIFAENLQTIHYAVSLGHHRSLIFYLQTEDLLQTSFALNGPQKDSYYEFAGVGIFRLSVGLEYVKDIMDDINFVLSKI